MAADPLNGYTVKEMIALVVLPKLNELSDEIRAVHTPSNCPLAPILQSQVDWRNRLVGSWKVLALAGSFGSAIIAAGVAAVISSFVG
jgi:hypothetical protein